MPAWQRLRGLALDDVDPPNGYIRVMGKGRKERYVPIGAKVSKALSIIADNLSPLLVEW
jgi:site-specific recombinase XerC